MSSTTGPSSPKQRSTKTAVPLLLSDFPSPPTHIPSSLLPGPSLAVLNGAETNPPPSLPPASPLPPVPGPSPLSEQDALRLINVSRASRRTSKASVYSSSSRSSSDRLHDSDNNHVAHYTPHTEQLGSTVVSPPTPSPSLHTFGSPSRPPSLADSVLSSAAAARRSTSISSSYAPSLSAHPNSSFVNHADRAKSPGLTAYLDRAIPEDDEGGRASLTALSLNDIPRASPSPHPSWRSDAGEDTSAELEDGELAGEDSIAQISMHDLPSDDPGEDEEDNTMSCSPMRSNNLNSSTSTYTYPRGGGGGEGSGSNSSRSSLDLHFPLPPTATPPLQPPPSAYPKQFFTPGRPGPGPGLPQTPSRDSISISVRSSLVGVGGNDNENENGRSSSPGIEDMLNRTPRPRRRSTSSLGSSARRASSSRRVHARASGPVRSVSVHTPASKKEGKGVRMSGMSTMSGVEVRLNGSELPYLRDSVVGRARTRTRTRGSGGEGEWNEDSFVEDYGTVIRGGDEFTLDDLTGGRHSPNPLADDVEASEVEDGDGDGDGNASDGSESSLDLHTPLPNLMLRDGLLSPHSKILPENLLASPSFDGLTPNGSFSPGPGGGGRPGSTLSIASNAGSVMTKSGIYKDERDTVRRRVRHRDGKLLKGGIGLTTGLGWSDSEDEDAPSPLTKRLSSVKLNRSPSTSSLPASASSSSGYHTRPASSPNMRPHPLSRSFSGSSYGADVPPTSSSSSARPRTKSSGAKPRKSSSILKVRSSLPESTLEISIPEHEHELGHYPLPVRFRSRSDGTTSITTSTVEAEREHEHEEEQRDRDRDKDSSSTSSTISFGAPITPVEHPHPVDLSSDQEGQVLEATSPSQLSAFDRDKRLPPLPLQPRKKASVASIHASAGTGIGAGTGTGIGTGIGRTLKSQGSVASLSLRSPSSVASLRSVGANCGTGSYSNERSTGSSYGGGGSYSGGAGSYGGSAVPSVPKIPTMTPRKSSLKLRKSTTGLSTSSIASSTASSIASSSSALKDNSQSTPMPGSGYGAVPRRSLGGGRPPLPGPGARTMTMPMPVPVRPLRLVEGGNAVSLNERGPVSRTSSGSGTGRSSGLSSSSSSPRSSGGLSASAPASASARSAGFGAGGGSLGIQKPRTGTGMVYRKSSGPTPLLSSAGGVGVGVGGTQSRLRMPASQRS